MTRTWQNSQWGRVLGLLIVAAVLLLIAGFASVLFPTASHPIAVVLAAIGGAAAVLGGFSVPGLVRARASGSVSVGPDPAAHREGPTP